jgi:peptidoglycan/LPS O-acetylase OafA/YrhL
LTAFRFFAAFAVFCRHVHPWLQDGTDLPSVVHSFMTDGFSGVTFFFVLSGFILTYNYRTAFAQLSGPSVWSFYAARVARIWPVHLLTFGFAAVVLHREILAAPGRFFGPALANLTLTQSFFPDEAIYFSFNSLSWSLSDEMFFYFLFPLIVWGMRSAGWDRPHRAALLAALLCGAAVTCVALGGHTGDGFWMWYINPAFRLMDFLTGVALGHLFVGLAGARGPGPKWASRLEVGALGLVAAALAASPGVPYLLRRSGYYTPFFAVLILVFAFQRGLVSRLLSGRVLTGLGEVSFSFYMFHYLFIRMIDRYPHATHFGDLAPLPRAGAVLALSLVVSACCYRWFEVPARARVRGWLLQRPAPVRAGQAVPVRAGV